MTITKDDIGRRVKLRGGDTAKIVFFSDGFYPVVVNQEDYPVVVNQEDYPGSYEVTENGCYNGNGQRCELDVVEFIEDDIQEPVAETKIQQILRGTPFRLAGNLCPKGEFYFDSSTLNYRNLDGIDEPAVAQTWMFDENKIEIIEEKQVTVTRQQVIKAWKHYKWDETMQGNKLAPMLQHLLKNLGL